MGLDPTGGLRNLHNKRILNKKKMSFKANSILVGVYLSFILYHLFVVCGYFNYYGLKKNEKGGTKTQN